MGRIAEAELERLKREVSLQRLVERAGVVLRPHGPDLVGLCPFHDDHEPSLVVTPAKNLWHCLGACGAGGSVVDWVMKAEKVPFRRAVEILRDAAGLTPLPVARSTAAALPLDVDDAELKRRVADFYRETLKQSPEALGYLEKRGLRSPEAIDTFQLGYANRTLAYRLPEKSRQAGAAIRARLQGIGILRESGHEHLSGSVTVPVFDEEGRVVQMYGRKIAPASDLRPGTPLHLYLPGPLWGVWNIQALQAGSGVRGEGAGVKEIILCEAIIDALTFWVNGFRNVTTSYGVNGFTEDHWAAFRKYGVARVFLAYDRDEAGDKAAAELAERLLGEGIECLRVLFPKGMDANEYALKVKPAAKVLGLALRQAEWLGKGCRKSGLGRRETGESDGRWEQGDGSIIGGTVAMEATDERGNEGIQRLDRVAEGDGPGPGNLPADEKAPTGGTLRAEQPDPAGGNIGAGEHRRGPGAPQPGGVCPVSGNRPGEPGGAGHPSFSGPAAGVPAGGRTEAVGPFADRDPQVIAGFAAEVPAAATLIPPVSAAITGDEIIINLDDRRWRIRGLSKNLSYDLLKVNVLVSRSPAFLPSPDSRLPSGAGGAFHIDTFDLYQARHRATFVKQAAIELGLKEDTVKADLGRVLMKLEELQDELIQQALAPKEKVVELTPEERAEALELLKDPNLLERILADFETCGVVGEETNKLVGYLAAVSRKLEKPLAVLIQSSSAAGKSALMEAVLAFLPEEEKVKYSAMTGQSLFYMGETDLRHKVLAIAEEAGAEKAAYALKMLQSEGELSIASTGKDPSTGRLVTHEYKVQGPVMVFLTTTSIEIDEELQNRCLVLTVDEDRAQTRAIHRLQRELRTREGYLRRQERERLLRLHQNAQRLLRRLPVFNPYARRLTFLDDKTRTRRDHEKYLDLIECVALLHQHQRPLQAVSGGGGQGQSLDVTLADIEVANRLANEVLGRSLDELPPQTRRLLELLHRMVQEGCARQHVPPDEYRFQRRELREYTGWSLTQVRVHLDRLVALEYVLVHRGGRGQNFVYELLYEGQGQDGAPFVVGLLDVEKLCGEAAKKGYDGNLAGFDPELAGSKRGQDAPKTGPKRGDEMPSGPGSGNGLEGIIPKKSENAYIPGNGKKPPAYLNQRPTAVFSLAAPAEEEGVRS